MSWRRGAPFFLPTLLPAGWSFPWAGRYSPHSSLTLYLLLYRFDRELSRQKCIILHFFRYISVFQVLFSSQPPLKWLYGVCYDNIFNLDGGESWSWTSTASGGWFTVTWAHHVLSLAIFGGADRNWTCYPLRAREMLYQMSYSPKI